MKQDEVQYVTNVDAFISAQNLRQLFVFLTSQLALVQPDDPISYLIEYLQNRTHQRLIYIHGINRNDTVNLSNSISVRFNYALIDLFELTKTEDINSIENDKINQLVENKIKSVQKSSKGIIICGYPNNHIQGQFIQRSGLLPERLFLLSHDPQIMEKYYIQQGNTPSKAKLLNTRNSMNTQQIKLLFGDLVDVLTQSLDEVKTTTSNILKIKDRSPYPLQSPRILAIYPPFLQPNCLKQLCKQFGLQFISIQSTFLKFKSEKNTFREYVRKFQQFTPQLQLAIVQTACTSIVAKKKGFVLGGWPNTVNKLTFLKEHYIKPHIILAFFDQKQELQKLFIKVDPNNNEIFPLKPKPTLEEFRGKMQDYNRFLMEVKKDPRTQIFTMETPDKDIVRSIENTISKSQVYK